MTRALLVLLVLLAARPAGAALTQAELDRVAADPPEGAALDLGAARPMVVVFVDFDCGELCDAILAQTAAELLDSGLAPGRDFELVAIGIDPRDPAEAAERMAAAQLPPVIAAATRLMRPDARELARMTQALGYGFAFDEENDRFAHPAARYVLTREGAVTRVLPAFRAEPGDLRLALVEAGAGRSGSLGDRLALLCYGFDAASGRYSLAISRILMVLMFGFGLVLAGFIALLLRRERKGGGP